MPYCTTHTGGGGRYTDWVVRVLPHQYFPIFHDTSSVAAQHPTCTDVTRELRPPPTPLLVSVLTNCEHGDRFRYLSLATLELEHTWNPIMKIALGCLYVGKGFMTFYFEYVNEIY